MMPQGLSTTFEPGFVARVAQGFRYAATGIVPDAFFGPSTPPAAIAPEAAGRQFDYPTGFNLRTTRHHDGLGFNDLRALADSYDLLRLVIETRKDQIARLGWTIGPRAGTGIPSTDPRSLALQRFFRKPDLEHDWATWLRLLLEDLLVLDAPCLYRRKSVTGAPYAFEIMDGALIKRVIDDRGRTPLPPDPAYQQILKGLPAVDYTTAELLYLPRNPRPNRVYGYGPVEQIVMSVNIALRRQTSQLAYFTEGNTPEALVGVPPEWTPDQIGQFQQYWDSLLAGDLGQRRHTRFVPGGLEYHPTREVTLKDQFDEWLARVVCFAFSVSPSAFITQVNRATAQTAQQTAAAEGLQPLKLWVKSLVDRLIEEDFGWGDLEFGWAEESAPDPATLMTINTGYVAAGIKTVDEARAEIGLGPVAGGEKPTPMPQLMQRGYDPDEPRDENGRWTTGGASTPRVTHEINTVTVSSTNNYADANQGKQKPSKQSAKIPNKLNAQRYGTARTRNDFETQRQEYASDALISQIGKIENGYNPDDPPDNFELTDDNWSLVGDNGTLGLYQFTHTALIDSGIKSENGWDTPFAQAYGIQSDRDFLDNHTAQNAAMGQFARRQEGHVDQYETEYGDDIYYDPDGNPIQVTSAGLLGALHKEGNGWVQKYFTRYGTDISLGLDIIPDGDHLKNVQNRLRWLQSDEYQ